jgi:hypothetical protein
MLSPLDSPLVAQCALIFSLRESKLPPRRVLDMADDNQNQNLPPPDQIETAGVQITERDIVFDCQHCGGELVVDMDGAGMKVACALCNGSLVVPEYNGPSLQFLQAATAKLTKAIQTARNALPKKFHFEGHSSEELKRIQNDLQRAIRENQAQTTEVRGRIHHATIQLHRFQLKLEVIQERQSELKAELDALQRAMNQR